MPTIDKQIHAANIEQRAVAIAGDLDKEEWTRDGVTSARKDWQHEQKIFDHEFSEAVERFETLQKLSLEVEELMKEARKTLVEHLLSHREYYDESDERSFFAPLRRGSFISIVGEFGFGVDGNESQIRGGAYKLVNAIPNYPSPQAPPLAWAHSMLREEKPLVERVQQYITGSSAQLEPTIQEPHQISRFMHNIQPYVDYMQTLAEVYKELIRMIHEEPQKLLGEKSLKESLAPLPKYIKQVTEFNFRPSPQICPKAELCTMSFHDARNEIAAYLRACDLIEERLRARDEQFQTLKGMESTVAGFNPKEMHDLTVQKQSREKEVHGKLIAINTVATQLTNFSQQKAKLTRDASDSSLHLECSKKLEEYQKGWDKNIERNKRLLASIKQALKEIERKEKSFLSFFHGDQSVNKKRLQGQQAEAKQKIEKATAEKANNAKIIEYLRSLEKLLGYIDTQTYSSLIDNNATTVQQLVDAVKAALVQKGKLNGGDEAKLAHHEALLNQEPLPSISLRDIIRYIQRAELSNTTVAVLVEIFFKKTNAPAHIVKSKHEMIGRELAAYRINYDYVARLLRELLP